MDGSKAYNQAMIDLEALQKQHQEYSQELMQNKIDIEELNDAIKEQQNSRMPSVTWKSNCVT